MRRLAVGSIVVVALLSNAATTFADDRRRDNGHFEVEPGVFDPARTNLVEAVWLRGIGCPTNARVSFDGSTTVPFSDPACPTGDPRDNRNQGLLLAKTGPTANFAAAFAEIKGVRGQVLTELGWDIRKPVSTFDPRGSHCGAGAPRWNIDTTDGGSFFIGCNSPPPTTQHDGDGWVRERWGGTAPLLAFSTSGVLTNITGKVIKSLSIVFDEGQDASGGPDQFGAAVLDNIDVNGVLVGRGESDEGGDND